MHAIRPLLIALTTALLTAITPAPLSSQSAAGADSLLVLSADPRPREGVVLLRWGYATAEVMERARRGGVTVSRRPIGGEGETVLAQGLVPDPLPTWKPRLDTSDFAAVLAQVLYGEEEPVGDGEQEADVRQAKFGLALFAADHDFGAATAAALGYTDESADPDERYVYSVQIDGAGDVAPVRLAVSAGVAIGRPAPQQPAGEWSSGGAVELSWLREATEREYSSYIVVRTELETNNWRRINSLPLVQLLNDENYDPRQYYLDKNVDPEQGYRYQILGITPFGRPGPASEIVVVPALEQPLVTAPRITTLASIVDSLYRVAWEPAGGDPADVASYRVASSPDAFGPFTYRTEALPAGTREATLVNPQDGDYVRIEVTDRRGRTVNSVAKIIRVFDQVPPAPPRGLKGTVDSFGRVVISWQPNPEEDLSGYRVFWANRPEGYFPQLTPDEIRDNRFTDSIAMNTRKKDVYYKVVAVDYTGNYSDYSEVLRLERPDLYPPTAPVIVSFRSDTGAVRLETAFSADADVLYHLLERRDDRGWTVLDTIREVADRAWLSDTSGVAGQLYTYRITAVDDAALRTSSVPLEASRTDNFRRAAVVDFTATVAGEPGRPVVSWAYPAGRNLRGFQLYRGADGGELVAYEFLTPASRSLRFRGGRFQYVDRRADAARYTYQLLAVHHDGGRSPLTPPRTVTLPR